MSLVSTADVLTSLRSNAQQGSTLYAQLDMLRRMAERAVKKYCKWGITANEGAVQGTFYEYYDGKGYADIALRKPWVVGVGNVYVNSQGAYGASNAFANTTPLTVGTDYAPVFEQTGLCKSGLLRRLNSGLFGGQGFWNSDIVFYNQPGGLSYAPVACWPAGMGNIKVYYDYGFQALTPLVSASWAGGVATFTFSSPPIAYPGEGFIITGATPSGWNGDYSVANVTLGQTTLTANVATQPDSAGNLTSGNIDFVPWDIKEAVVQTISIARNADRYGGRMTSESLGDYTINISTDPLFGTVKQILSSYRDWAVGIGL